MGQVATTVLTPFAATTTTSICSVITTEIDTASTTSTTSLPACAASVTIHDSLLLVEDITRVIGAPWTDGKLGVSTPTSLFYIRHHVNEYLVSLNMTVSVDTLVDFFYIAL